MWARRQQHAFTATRIPTGPRVAADTTVSRHMEAVPPAATTGVTCHPSALDCCKPSKSRAK
jgi:hypothetical protein